jgi:hypothetical protein
MQDLLVELDVQIQAQNLIATFTSLYPEAVKMVLNSSPFFHPITVLIR